MNNTDHDQVQKIVSLKRHEAPRHGYFDEFLEEFQQRRDAESPQKSPSLPQRLASSLRTASSLKWVAGASLAYAALITLILLWPAGPGTTPDPDRAPASFQGSTPPNSPPPPSKESKTPPPEF